MQMRIFDHCRECTVRQAHDIVVRGTKDEKLQAELETRILAECHAIGYEVCPPAYARIMLKDVYDACGTLDLYQAEKDACTALARKLMTLLRPRVEAMADSFPALVRLAIGGNILDYGINDSLDLDEAGRRMEEVFHLPLQEDALAELWEALDRAQNVFYILDNCGEAVFDGWLLERYRDKVTLGVRGGPVLNDVTRRELAASGLGGFPVLDTGDLTPGVLVEHSSPDFVAMMEQADVVVAKGQGNFESMMSWKHPAFYLFRAKCPVIRELLGGVEANSLQIIHTKN